MKKAVFILTALATAIGIFAAACTNPERDIKESEKKVEQLAVSEQPPMLYDNKRNFLVVTGAYYSDFVVVMQKWVDEHPGKRLISFSCVTSDYIGMAYYEDRR
ncbi:MAG: hypothetical protein HYV47_01895 [Candidatus Nealsonbacteria bacterium]|nr:hypothetical protein [Candidatus Nealsonbacteria bacterium]